ncbi:hypothetical protein OCH239_13670 [Roseivivax halodurans JCM 10272]|uniref:TonB-denpendent receptor n=1 Tax=Roseivivax halodurans JCM 10272 TaxID=1449350 RepID=X7ED68_9RHOB|nr:TonB-dependent receptor [Roseivivax halodurans]ETX13063.1 hypothetical protein OCH239_13670 [Roseivivax halodurans JCM 10272]
MTRLLITVSSIALALPAASRAQEQEAIELDPITIYGNQADLPISRTGASVAIIEEDALQTAPSASLTDIIADTPGVTFTQTGGPAGLSYGNINYSRVRGLDQKYAPVLFNGIDISDPTSTGTSFDWANLMLGGLSRAEVVKGSQSALYGSEAVAGIFALTGADAPEAPGTEGSIALEAGAFNTRRASLSYGAATERAGFAVSASRARTDGFSAFSSDGEEDGFAGGQYSFDAYYNVSQDLRVGLTGFSFDSEFDYDPNPNTGDTLQRGLRAYVEAQTGAVAHSFNVSRFSIDRETPNAYYTEYEGERDEVSYLATWDTSPALTLSYGADWTLETAASTTDEEIEVIGLFGEAQYAATETLDLSLSLRHDDNSQFGGSTTGRAALTWRAAPDLTVRSSLGNGFRAPSLSELYGTFGANPDLDPETSRSFDLGVEKTFVSGAQVTATLFHTEVDDLIQYVEEYQQVSGTSVSQGIELSGEVPLGDRVTLTGAYTYTDARNANDDPLERVARHALDLGLAADITDRIQAGASLQHRADLPDTFGATGFSRQEVDDYTVANARFGYSFGEGREAYIRVENLFDADYEVIPGYETSGRAAYFGVRASF